MVLPSGNDSGAVARWFERSLRERVMPYWLRTSPDPRFGGYRHLDYYQDAVAAPRRRRWPLSHRQPRAEPSGLQSKPLVMQGRMLYGFSLAHRLRLGEGDQYLRAAELGYRFLRDVMLDREYGGMFAIAAEDGAVLDSRKLLCNHAFAIYGLVEYHRAGGDPAPLELALELYRTLHARLHDPAHGGWIEHADRDFRPLRYTVPPSAGLVGEAERKSADASLHWMEALAELQETSGSAEVAASLAESLHLNRTFFFPAEHAGAFSLRTREWRALGSRYDNRSYGHAVEFAWLMIRAEQVLGLTPSWAHFHTILNDTLRWGYDRGRGGFFFAGRGAGPVTDRRKAWWVQAEAIAALADGLGDREEPSYRTALAGLVDWVLRHHVLSDDEIWITSTDESGRPLDRTKAGPWKGAYHDVRAMSKYIAAFG